MYAPRRVFANASVGDLTNKDTSVVKGPIANAVFPITAWQHRRWLACERARSQAKPSDARPPLGNARRSHGARNMLSRQPRVSGPTGEAPPAWPFCCFFRVRFSGTFASCFLSGKVWHLIVRSPIRVALGVGAGAGFWAQPCSKAPAVRLSVLLCEDSERVATLWAKLGI